MAYLTKFPMSNFNKEYKKATELLRFNNDMDYLALQMIESNCLELVQEIERNRDSNRFVLDEMKEIMSFFHRAWELQVVWCKRDVNVVADYLAKHALTLGNGFVSFNEVPVD